MMTRKNYFEKVTAMLEALEESEECEEMLTITKKEIEKLEKKSTYVSKKREEKQAEDAKLKKAILEVLNDKSEPVNATQIFSDVLAAFPEINMSKVTYLLTAMSKNGEVVKTTDKRKNFYSVA